MKSDLGASPRCIGVQANVVDDISLARRGWIKLLRVFVPLWSEKRKNHQDTKTRRPTGKNALTQVPLAGVSAERAFLHFCLHPYIASDIHKHYVVVAGINRDGDAILRPRKIPNGQLPSWGAGHLLPSDRVVVEATTNAWHVYDMLAPLVAEVKVANPIRVRQIAKPARRWTSAMP